MTARLGATLTTRTTKKGRKMNDPTVLVEKTAQSYARLLGEDWSALDAERRQRWRMLAYHIYVMHCTNKLSGMKIAIDEVDDVLLAPSTPKRWLPGVQEAKNALVVLLSAEMDALEMRVTVPDSVPEGLDAQDPYEDTRAGDRAPVTASEPELQCGEIKPSDEDGFGWTCTRPKHPAHWMHWDDDPGEWYEDADGEILVTWHTDGPLESIHNAVIEFEDGE